MIGASSVSILSHLELHQHLPIQCITPEKWLICGQRKEEVSVHGTIVTDNASNGWLPIWTCNSTTYLEDIWDG